MFFGQRTFGVYGSIYNGKNGAEDLTKTTLFCRRQTDDIVKNLREYVPRYEKCFFINSTSFIGIRETRRFKVKYTLTKQDILKAEVFDGYVVKDAYFTFDVQNIKGSELSKTDIQKYFPQENSYTMPYRCLLPKIWHAQISELCLSSQGTVILQMLPRIFQFCKTEI